MNKPQSISFYKDDNGWLTEVPRRMKIVRNKYLFKEINERSYDNSKELLTVSQFTGISKRADTINKETDLLTNAESLDGYKIVKKGDLVINIMLAWNGSLGVSPFDGIVSPAYCVYRLKENMNPFYFHYLYRTDLFKSYFQVHSSGIVDSRLRLYTDDFFSLKSIVPKRSEQDAIVDYLDHKLIEIDEYIYAKKKLLNLLEEQNLTIISKIVTTGMGTGHFVATGLTWFKKMPVNWQVVPAKFLCKTIVDCKNRTPVHFENGEYVVVRTSNVKKRRLVLQDLMKTDESNFIEWTKRGGTS